MSSNQYVYVMKGLNKSFGDKKIIKDGWLSFLPGAKIGVLGLNGAGKSTILKIMAGLDTEFGGEAWAAEGKIVGYLPQEPELDNSLDVTGNVMKGVKEVKSLLDEFEKVSLSFSNITDDSEMDKLLSRQSLLQEKIEAADGWQLERKIKIAMEALRCPEGDANISSLSGGELRRVALCSLLLSEPDILLLDEPTNHLDAETVSWLERSLLEYKGTVVAVTHDRYFLDNVAQWILEIDRGNLRPYEGNYSNYLERKQKQFLMENKEQTNLVKAISKELNWVNSSQKARQTKNQARISAYDALVSKANAFEKVKSIQQIFIPSGSRLGDMVIDVKSLTKSYGDKVLFDNLSFKIPAGAIVGIIGSNGAGKTTLFRILTGEEDSDSGSIIKGETVKLGYIDQNRENLNNEKTVWDEVSSGSEELLLGDRLISSRAYVSWFNFKGSDQQKKVADLSGGERNRVNLAKMLLAGANVLLLDEPTNDLDVDTLRALEEAIENFSGCILVVSHDRYFLDRISTHILAFEGESHVEWYQGSYHDYESDYKKRFGELADQPHRIKYKPIKR